MSDLQVFLKMGSAPMSVLRLSAGSVYRDILSKIGHCEDVFLCKNGLVKNLEDAVENFDKIEIHGRLRGGKGGFGSMLRAIGAQIEKTTNREACRDLSGRRLRAINDEKRVRHYAKVKQEKEKERQVKKRKKLERLANAKPRHTFKDDKYFEDREAIPQEVEDAVEEAFAKEEEPSSSKTKDDMEPSPKKFKGWMGDLEDFEDSDSEEDSDEGQEKDVEDDTEGGEGSKRGVTPENDVSGHGGAEEPTTEEIEPQKQVEGKCGD